MELVIERSIYSHSEAVNTNECYGKAIKGFVAEVLADVYFPAEYVVSDPSCDFTGL